MRGKIAHATGNIRRLAVLVLFGQLVNLGLTFYFVGVLKMGAVGAALSTFLVAAIIAPLFLWNIGLRMVNLGLGEWFRRTAWPGLLPTAAGSAAWLALQWMVAPAGWVHLVGCVLAGAVVYVLVLALFCLQSTDRNDLRHAWNAARSLLGRRPSP